MLKNREPVRFGNDGSVSLPKMLFEKGQARRLEAGRGAIDEVGGHNGSDILRGGAARDDLSDQDRKQDSHWFSLPTAGDNDEIVVTGRKMISDSKKHVLVGGKYYENPNYNPRFDITLGQALGFSALAGAGAAFPPLLAGAATLSRGRGTISKLEQNARDRGDIKLADHYAEPYPRKQMGEHVIARKHGKSPITAAIVHHPYNVLKPAGISRGGMYQLHYECDNSYHGGPLPRRMNEKGWKGKAEGLNQHGPLRWIWECTTPAMKAGAGLVGAAGLAVHEALGANERRVQSKRRGLKAK